MTDIVCPQCRAAISPAAANFRIKTKRIELVFCHRECAKEWALVEVTRLMGWLTKIAIKARGLGHSLAVSALWSNTSAQ